MKVKKKWRMKRNRIKTYLRQMEKGHAPNVREQDIRFAFKTMQRMEMFDVGLDQVDAHTLRLVEMIEAEKGEIAIRKKQEMERKVKQ